MYPYFEKVFDAYPEDIQKNINKLSDEKRKLETNKKTAFLQRDYGLKEIHQADRDRINKSV